MSTIQYVPYTFPFVVNPTPLGAMVFMSGVSSSSSPVLLSVDKYDYNANTWSPGTLMIYNVAWRFCQSNKVFALAMLGSGGPPSPLLSDRYYFASDSTESTTSAVAGSGTGIGTSMGFADAMVSGWASSITRTSRYYYATDTVDRGGNVIGQYTLPYAGSGPNMGIVIPGSQGSARAVETYFWPSDTRVFNTTQLPQSITGRSVIFTNADTAIISRALTNKICYKMPWASGTCTASGSLSVATQYGQGASTSTFGMLVSAARPSDQYSVVAEKYNFPTDTTTFVTSAITPRYQGSAASDAPGNL